MKYPVMKPVRRIVSILRLAAVAIGLLCVCQPTTSMAQNRIQKGIARKITKSAGESVVPVSGVQVTVGNVTSQKSDANGLFKVNIAQNSDGTYKLANVRMPENTDYVLVLPNISKTLYLSPNELEVVVISKKEKDEDYKEKYRTLKKKYNETSKGLISLREELEDKKLDYDIKSAEYAMLTEKLDSVQNLLNLYFSESNRDQVAQLLQSIAEEMAVTDYQSLDSLERRIYDLKCEGDWLTISRLILSNMNGDCAKFLKEGKEMTDAASAFARTAQAEFERRCHLAEQQIEAYRMLHLNDSVSYYYDVLVEVNPTDWDYISQSAAFEDEFRGNVKKALALQQRAYEVADDDSLRAISLNNIGVIYANHGYYKEALDYVERSIALRLSHYGEDDLSLINSYGALASIYSSLDQADKANEMLLKARVLLDRADDKSKLVTHLINEGAQLRKMDRREDALDVYAEALSLIEDSTDEETLLKKAIIYDHIGVLNSELSRYSAAYKAYMESLEIQIPILGETHPDVAQNLINLGALFETLSQYDTAKEYTESALEIYMDIYGERSSAVAMAYNNLGNIIVKKEPRQGLDMLEKAMDINEDLYGHKHTTVALVLSNMSSAYMALGDVDMATKVLEEAMDIYRELYGESYSGLALAYNNFAAALKAANDTEKALEYYQKALEINKKIYGENSSTTATSYSNLGVLYHALREYDTALDYLQKALSIREAVYGEENGNVAASYRNIANCYIDKGEIDLAKENYERALKINKGIYGSESVEYMSNLMDYAYMLTNVKDFDRAKELGTEVRDFYIKNLGDTHPTTLNSISFMSYVSQQEAKANHKEEEFYLSHIPYVYIVEGGEAYKRGLQGKYVMVGYDVWDFTMPESFDSYLQNHPDTYTVLFYRDGEIIKETFTGKAGFQAVWEPAERSVRSMIEDSYKKWLENGK